MWKPQISIRCLPLLPFPLSFEIGFGDANSVVLASQQVLRSFCIRYVKGEIVDVDHCI